MHHANTTCNDTVSRLPWLINGSLGDAEEQQVTDHLASCAGCRDQYEQTLDAWELFAALGVEGEDFSDADLDDADISAATVVDFAARRARRAPQGAGAPGTTGRWSLPMALAAVAACAVLALGFLTGPLYGPGSGEQAATQATLDLDSVPPPAEPVDAESDLEAAAETGVVFRSGFESGNLEGWSLVTDSDSDPEGDSNHASTVDSGRRSS